MDETKSCSSGVIRYVKKKGFEVGVEVGEHKQYSQHLTCSGQSGGGVGVDNGEPQQYPHHLTYSGQRGGGVEVEIREYKQFPDLRNSPFHPLGIVSKTKRAILYIGETSSYSWIYFVLWGEEGFFENN